MGALAASTALHIGVRDVLAADINEQRLETM
jgi:threonine dehydrogenase-like Zn-dependent dehydrogenase